MQCRQQNIFIQVKYLFVRFVFMYRYAILCKYS